MNDHEQQLFEDELRRLSPAKVPDELAERLIDARQEVAPVKPVRESRACRAPAWCTWMFRFRPASTALGVALVVLVAALAFTLLQRPRPIPNQSRPVAAAAPTLRADDVQIDRQLVNTFDAVATLPDGEPVRVRCREWMDEVVLRDTEHGVAIQQRTPRFELIPVRFETF